MLGTFVLVGCGNLLGLDEYEVNPTGMGGSASSTGANGTGGNAGEAGAGAAGSCTCEDRNECTTNECEDGDCIFSPAAEGTACSEGVCDGDGACVVCVDDAAGSGRDAGCPAGSPVCDENDDPPSCTGCEENADCDDGIECTSDSCSEGACSNQVLPAGSPCSEGVCNGQGQLESCVACIDDDPAGVDSGCSAAEPVCDPSRSPLACGECARDADCDDGNACTLDLCEVGACMGSTVSAGEACQEGYCNGVPGEEACVACIDDGPGDAVDLGCSERAPACDTSLAPAQCTGCLTNADCDDGISCTTDVCNGSGACVRTANDELCPDSGDACQPNRCVVGSGCQVVDLSEPRELIVDGGFDSAAAWVQASSTNYDILYHENDTPVFAHSFPRLAWLAGLPDELSELWTAVPIEVPAGTRSLDFSIYYHIDSNIETADTDTAGAMLRAADGEAVLETFVEWGNQDATTDWTRFSARLEASSLEEDQVQVYLWAKTSSWSEQQVTDVFLDTVSLVANVCPEG